MRLWIHPAASAEVENEARYYDDQAVGLGEEFLDEVDHFVARICESPQQFPEVERGIRKCVLHQFPFTIRYRLRSDLIEILVVRHDARDDDYGRDRY